MRVLIATDAWEPQINGVVQTLSALASAAKKIGVEFVFLTPDEFLTIPLPSYASIRLALPPPGAIGRLIGAANADAIHVATEGPIGHAVRRYCLRHGLAYTTSFMTRFPDYVRMRTGIPEAWSWAYLRRFHGAAACVMVPTTMLAGELTEKGFRNVAVCPHGVDTQLFRPDSGKGLDVRRPIFLSVGRVAVEKNLQAFLSLDLPGSKIVVGDGPALKTFKQQYSHVHFFGALRGQALAEVYAAADVFVFPSRTDTFGLVLLEALASGVPIAAFPVQAPRDLLSASSVAVLDEDLRRACLRALHISRHACRAFALDMSWDESVRRVLSNLRPAFSPQWVRSSAVASAAPLPSKPIL